MFRNMYAHLYKMTKMPLFGLMFVWPVVFVALFISYYSVASWSPEQKISGYFQALAIGMPCLVAVYCAYVARQEQRAGAFFNLLCVGHSRMRTFMSLFVLLATQIAIELTVASFGLYLFWGQMLFINYVLTTILMLVPLSFLLLLQMFIAFKYGGAWSVAVGAIFLLVGALGVTGLVDGYWYILPPTWAPRFSSLVIADVFHPYYIVQIAAELRRGLLFCLIFTAVVMVLVPRWFHKWDGKPGDVDE